MVPDGAGRHANESLKPPVNMRLLPLPPYAPECNPAEQVWDELREKFFHNKVFDSLDALEDPFEFALKTYEDNHATIKSTVAREWIISALLK